MPERLPYIPVRTLRDARRRAGGKLATARGGGRMTLSSSTLSPQRASAVESEMRENSFGAALSFASISGQEGDFTRFVAEWGQGHGLRADLWETDDAAVAAETEFDRHISLAGRPTLVLELPGEPDLPSLLLNAHADVVSPGDRTAWRHDPWSGDFADGRFYGRGACDAKGPLVKRPYGPCCAACRAPARARQRDAEPRAWRGRLRRAGQYEQACGAAGTPTPSLCSNRRSRCPAAPRAAAAGSRSKSWVDRSMVRSSGSAAMPLRRQPQFLRRSTISRRQSPMSEPTSCSHRIRSVVRSLSIQFTADNGRRNGLRPMPDCRLL